MKKKFIKELISIVIGILIFILWTKLVGNPHVIETIIGIVISILLSGFIYSRLKKLF